MATSCPNPFDTEKSAVSVRHIRTPNCLNEDRIKGARLGFPALAEAAHLKAPTLIIVGEVAKLHDQVAWHAEGR